MDANSLATYANLLNVCLTNHDSRQMMLEAMIAIAWSFFSR